MGSDTSGTAYLELKTRSPASGARGCRFVGAGLSANGSPRDRLPVWHELIERQRLA